MCWFWNWSFSFNRNQKTYTISITLISICAYLTYLIRDTISISNTYISNTACCWWENTFSIAVLDESMSTSIWYIILNTESFSITVISSRAFVVIYCLCWINRNRNICKIRSITLFSRLNSWYIDFCRNWWALCNKTISSISNIYLAWLFLVLRNWTLNKYFRIRRVRFIWHIRNFTLLCNRWIFRIPKAGAFFSVNNTW